MDIVVTAPSVVYKILKPDESVELIDTPAKLPDPSTFDEIFEPYVQIEMITPSECNGVLMELAQNRRGIFVEMKYLTTTRTNIIYEVGR